MDEGFDLSRAQIFILCEPLYDLKLFAQAPARARRKEFFKYILGPESF